MKKEIKKISSTELEKSYPIQGQTENWFYRKTETSNGAWLVEGMDHWNRKISLTGHDPDALLREADSKTKEINGKL